MDFYKGIMKRNTATAWVRTSLLIRTLRQAGNINASSDLPGSLAPLRLLPCIEKIDASPNHI